jgi:phenylacetate-CoA ligase
MESSRIVQDIMSTPQETMTALQDRLLRQHLVYVAERSAFYRGRFREVGVRPGDVRGVADLHLLPTTSKQQLDAHNEEFLCTPHSEVVDICLTSGTTARPVVLLQTRADLARLERNEEQGFTLAGVDAADRVMVCAAMDRCFMAGLAYFLGLVRIGATVIRAGSSSLPVALELVRTQRPTVLVGVPTLLKTMAERLLQENDTPRSMGVSTLVCIGEPVRTPDFDLSPLGGRLHELWGARIHGTYAGTEMATAFTECSAGRGGHLPPDLAVVEILDDAGAPVPDGEPGEVVVTPLGVTGMPLVRFRTGDVAMLHSEPCACGRATPRLGPILGRKNQVLKYRGTTVFPNAIFTVLQELEGIRGFYLEVRDEYELSDHIRVVVGVEDPQTPPMSGAEVAERIAARVRVKPEVVLAPAHEVARKVQQPDKRKPVTFFDFRTRLHGRGRS